MLNKRTLVSGLAAAALAATVVAQTTAPASAHDYHHHRYYDHHDDDDWGAGLGVGLLGLAAGAVIGGALVPHEAYYGDGYYAPPPVYYGPGPAYYGSGPAYYGSPDYYPPAPRGRVRETAYDHVARCEAHYRTYDPRTDTFMGYDGRPHYCRL